MIKEVNVMKKLLAYILLVCMILSLAACSPATDKQDEITDNNKTENVSSMPSRLVTFESIEELIELKEALEKDGEKLEKYFKEGFISLVFNLSQVVLPMIYFADSSIFNSYLLL